MIKRLPMTADEARDNVREMLAHTRKSARIALLQAALGPLGNLSDAARTIYATQLAEDAGCAS